jgi:hypothetical protein
MVSASQAAKMTPHDTALINMVARLQGQNFRQMILAANISRQQSKH